MHQIARDTIGVKAHPTPDPTRKSVALESGHTSLSAANCFVDIRFGLI